MPQMQNRVQETTTTGGTGTLTLAGAVTGYITFASGFSTGTSLFYTIDNGVGEWEIGIGTLVTTGTLSRVTVIASSNGGALVNFGSGTKRVFCSAPTRSLVPDQDSKSGYVLTTDGTNPAWTQTLNGITIGNLTAAGGAFTTLSASSTVSGTGFSTYLASPPAIGGTTPAAGAFTTLSSTGNTTLGDAAGDTLTINAGTTNFAGTGQRITGDFSNATIANRVMFQTSTTNSTTSIGVLPNGTSTFTNLNLFSGTDPANASIAQVVNTGTEVSFRNTLTGTGTAVPMTFYTGGTERMRLDSSGNVGIGAPTNNVFDGVAAARPLLVQSASSSTVISATTNAIVICNSDTTTDNTSQINFAAITGASTNQYSSALITAIHGARVNGQYPTGQLVFSTSSATNSAPTEKMRIDSSGNVGIGTSSPSAKLHVNSSASAMANFNGNNANNFIQLSDNNGVNVCTVGSIAGGNFYLYSTGYGAFYTGSAERMRLDSSGQCIWKPNGVTSAMTLDASGNLLVGQTSNATFNAGTVFGKNSGNTVGQTAFAYNSTYWWNVGTYSNGSFLIYRGSDNAGVFLSWGATAWSANSDERIKTDLQPINNAAKKVASLRAVTGRFKTDEVGVSRAFLIAQDVQKVLPEAVDAADPEKLGVRYTDTIPLLVAAIKELHAEIETLKQRIQ